MMRQKLPLVLLALLVSAGAVLAQTTKAATPDANATPAAPAPAIKWLSYDDGIAKTKGSDKHMLVDITAPGAAGARRWTRRRSPIPG